MNFLDRYIHTAGVTFTPPAFHRWACLSLVAAALAEVVGSEGSEGSEGSGSGGGAQ